MGRRGLLLSYTPGAIAVLEGRNDTSTMNLLRWLLNATNSAAATPGSTTIEAPA